MSYEGLVLKLPQFGSLISDGHRVTAGLILRGLHREQRIEKEAAWTVITQGHGFTEHNRR
jgi:hypothetical protein